ncbi:MAG: hypothetical protein QXM16_00315 [Nitrososphaerota archaeon]
MILGFWKENIQGKLLNQTTTPYFPTHRSKVSERWIRAWVALS